MCFIIEVLYRSDNVLYFVRQEPIMTAALAIQYAARLEMNGAVVVVLEV